MTQRPSTARRRYGVWCASDGAWLHCPITGARIRGDRERMQQYASDMAYLSARIRLVPPSERMRGFSVRRLDAAPPTTTAPATPAGEPKPVESEQGKDGEHG